MSDKLREDFQELVETDFFYDNPNGSDISEELNKFTAGYDALTAKLSDAVSVNENAAKKIHELRAENEKLQQIKFEVLEISNKAELENEDLRSANAELELELEDYKSGNRELVEALKKIAGNECVGIYHDGSSESMARSALAKHGGGE